MNTPWLRQRTLTRAYGLGAALCVFGLIGHSTFDVLCRIVGVGLIIYGW